MVKNQVKQPNNEQISFEAYYEAKKQEVQTFREEIRNMLGISIETFYRKLRNNSWSEADMRLISHHMGIERDILFPNKTA